MLISNNSLQTLHSTINIADVIGEFISLTNKSGRLWACCPFHKEKTPSFTINIERGIFKCFGCGESGDAISFIKKIENFTFVEAVEFLAKKYNIELGENSDPESLMDLELSAAHLLLSNAKDFYKNNLNNSPGLNYLFLRNISQEAISKYDLGYAPSMANNSFYFSIKSIEYSVAILDQTGLFLKRGSEYFDRFNSRVVFPIASPIGKILGFGSRKISDTSFGPKYINSPESNIFKKKNILYGLFQAKNDIRRKNFLYLVEGYIDVIAMYDAGLKNSIASMGTSLTEDQIFTIKRYTNDVVVVFDGDEAGVNASLKCIDMMLSLGLNVKLVNLPKNEDPFSLKEKLGNAEFEKFILANTFDFTQYKIDKFFKNSEKSDIENNTSNVNSILQSLIILEDSVKRAFYIKKISKELSIDENILYKQIRSLSTKKKNYGKKIESIAGEKNMFGVEVILVEILLNFITSSNFFTQIDEFKKKILPEIDDVELLNKSYNKILSEVKVFFKSNFDFESKNFMDSLSYELKNLVNNLITPNFFLSKRLGVDNDEIKKNEQENITIDLIYKNILAIKSENLKKMMDSLMNKMKQNSNHEESMINLDRYDLLKKLSIEISEKIN